MPDFDDILMRLECERDDLNQVIDELKADHSRLDDEYWIDRMGSVGHRLVDIELELD